MASLRKRPRRACTRPRRRAAVMAFPARSLICPSDSRVSSKSSTGMSRRGRCLHPDEWSPRFVTKGTMDGVRHGLCVVEQQLPVERSTFWERFHTSVLWVLSVLLARAAQVVDVHQVEHALHLRQCPSRAWLIGQRGMAQLGVLEAHAAVLATGLVVARALRSASKASAPSPRLARGVGLEGS